MANFIVTLEVTAPDDYTTTDVEGEIDDYLSLAADGDEEHQYQTDVWAITVARQI